MTDDYRGPGPHPDHLHRLRRPAALVLVPCALAAASFIAGYLIEGHMMGRRSQSLHDPDDSPREVVIRAWTERDIPVHAAITAEHGHLLAAPNDSEPLGRIRTRFFPVLDPRKGRRA